MGKKTGSSWLTAVKRAFRSPSKDHKEKKSCRRTEHEHHEEDEEKRGKKSGWLFRKSETKARGVCNNNNMEGATVMSLKMEGEEQEMHAAAVASANATAAADASAAAKKVRLNTPPPGFIIHHWAAIVIQTSYRGYLARKALRALRGIVKLQALVRGHNVRQQAKLTLQCMQALVRVQEKVLNSRMSHESTRNSMFIESNMLWDSKSLQDIRSRRSLSRERSCNTDNEWNGHEETDSVLQKKLNAALKREKALAYAFSNQIRRGSRRKTSVGEERELFQKPNWLDRWMATKQWDDALSTDASVKTVQMDTFTTPYSNSRRRSLNRESSPPRTPPSSLGAGPRLTGVRSASPRCSVREERCYSAAHTPCLRSKALLMPNYMIATESAKARARPQSTPRQRPVTPDRDRSSGFSVKKRLHYPEEQFEEDGLRGYSQSLKNPSFKSSFSGNCGAEIELSDYSSCYGFHGEISPCSTTDLRWLK